MGISEDPRKLIAKEIDYVVNKMNGTQDAAEKLYYFSGIHSAIQRVFNFESNTSSLPFIYPAKIIFVSRAISNEVRNMPLGIISASLSPLEFIVPYPAFSPVSSSIKSSLRLKKG